MTGDGRELVFSRWKFALVVAPFLLLMNAVSLTLVLGHELGAVTLGERLGGVFFAYLLSLVIHISVSCGLRGLAVHRRRKEREAAGGRPSPEAVARGAPLRLAGIELGGVGDVFVIIAVAMSFLAFLPFSVVTCPPDENAVLGALFFIAAIAVMLVLFRKLWIDSEAARERRERFREWRRAREFRREAGGTAGQPSAVSQRGGERR